MDRLVPRRRRIALLLGLTFTLALGSATGGLARSHVASDTPAGDPGDGVLRPADISPHDPLPADPTTKSIPTAEASTPTGRPVTFVLVPHFALPGQPWLVTFRLIRVDRAGADAWAGREQATSFGGRWYRAP